MVATIIQNAPSLILTGYADLTVPIIPLVDGVRQRGLC